MPKPRPYVAGGDYGALGGHGETGIHDDPWSHADAGAGGSHDQPEDYDEPAGYEEPGDHRPDDADSGAGSDDEHDDYSQFWNPGRGGGAHASAAVPARASAPPPGVPGDTSVYRPRTARRQLGALVAVAAVIVAAAVVAVVFLLGRHGPARHPAAAGHTPAGHSHGPSPAPSLPPPTLAATGASGHLGVPSSIGSLQLNRALTREFVGPAARRRDANSFFIPDSDVLSGFYTSDPAATSFTAREPRLMFLVAYLAGTGSPGSYLHAFLTNHSFTGQQQVSAGPQGGVAACGLLPQTPAPVAHCMWADANSYADFYAWNTSTSALAKTMISIRPMVELGRR